MAGTTRAGDIDWAASFAHRKLRHLPQYCAAPRQAQERLLGVYEDVSGAVAESIVLTNECLYLREAEGWVRVPYRAICAVALPLPEEVPLPQRKLRADRVELTLTSGQVIAVPVRGGTYLEDGTPRTRDAYLIYTFIGRTVAALRRAESAPVAP